MSAAKWRLNAGEVKGKDLSEWLELKGVSHYFSVGTGDQTLYFDRTDKKDLLFFNSYLKQYNDFVITEVIIADKQAFRDIYKNDYFTQILLTLTHDELLYPSYSPEVRTSKNWKNKEIVPGKDWIYFEIYCHPQKADMILSRLISKFIKKNESAFKTWFYIRYDYPSPHLRLRFQLYEKKDGYYYIGKLMDLFSVMLNDGVINDIQLKTYKPEILRYGVEQMKATEQHFKTDSEYALKFIKAGLEPFDIYAQTILLMKNTLNALNMDQRVQLRLIEEIQRSFEVEHGMTGPDFKIVNKEWSVFSNLNLPNRRINALYSDILILQNSFINLMEATEVTRRSELFFSLFHMHVNRLFNMHQRTHEMIIYSFLSKLLKREFKQQELVLAQFQA